MRVQQKGWSTQNRNVQVCDHNLKIFQIFQILLGGVRTYSVLLLILLVGINFIDFCRVFPVQYVSWKVLQLDVRWNSAEKHTTYLVYRWGKE